MAYSTIKFGTVCLALFKKQNAYIYFGFSTLEKHIIKHHLEYACTTYRYNYNSLICCHI